MSYYGYKRGARCRDTYKYVSRRLLFDEKEIKMVAEAAHRARGSRYRLLRRHGIFYPQALRLAVFLVRRDERHKAGFRGAHSRHGQHRLVQIHGYNPNIHQSSDVILQ